MIKKELLEGLKEKFLTYTNRFESKDIFVQEHFKVKQQHTLRVCKNIVEIGRKIGLKNDQLIIAETIGLFHDIGRFEQYKQYQTFSDFESVNHSDLSVRVIRDNNFLHLFPEKYREMICTAILYHNCPEPPENINEELCVYVKLIRDADKLDVYRVVREYEEKEESISKVLSPNEYKIPDHILNAFNRKSVVHLKPGMHKNDYLLYRVSWIFDINFQPTFQLLDQQNHLGFILNKIPKSYRLRNIHNIVKEYMMEKFFAYA